MNKSSKVKLILDLDLQPISNRYVTNVNDDELLFNLKIGQCQKTSLIQLIDPIPYKELVPRFDWITYNEPEDHLDDLVTKIYKFLSNDETLTVGGISYKDDSTLERFSKKKCKTWRIDLENDLSLEKYVGIESIQATLNSRRAVKISERYGKADLLVVRHIWEHVYNHNQFSEALKELISDNGYILFEVPDCRDLLKFFDCTMIWEEHTYYFTANTVKLSLQKHGFEILAMDIFEYTGENSIALLVKANNLQKVETNKSLLKKEIQMGYRYVKGLEENKKFILKYFDKIKDHGKVVVYGAGHLASTFITCKRLEKYIRFDNVDVIINIGLDVMLMPNSNIPIVSSEYKGRLY